MIKVPRARTVRLFVVCCSLALLVSGCRRLQDGLNLQYWESGVWPAKKGNVIIKYKASWDIVLYYREYCEDIPDVLTKGRCIAAPILDSVEGNDQAALIVKASVENAAVGDTVDAQDIIDAVQFASDDPYQQCFHIRANGFASDPLNWSTRNKGNDNCTDGQAWDWPGFTDDSCSNCVPAPDLSFKHYASLTPQPGPNPTNSCIRQDDAYLCRLVQPDPQGHAFVVYKNPNSSSGSNITTSQWMGSSYGYWVKLKNGKTYEGCERTYIGSSTYKYECAYETKNHWSRRVTNSTVRYYYNAAYATWKSVSCGLELAKVFNPNGSANPSEMARKCDGVDW